MALFNPSWLWMRFFQCATCELKKERFSIDNVAIYKIFNRQWWLGIQKSCYLGQNQLKAFWIKNVLKISWDNQTVIHQHRLFKVKWINSCYNYPTSHWIWAIRGVWWVESHLWQKIWFQTLPQLIIAKQTKFVTTDWKFWTTKLTTTGSAWAWTLSKSDARVYFWYNIILCWPS